MPFAYSKLHGVPADRLLAAIDPILAAHGLEGVELIWKTDNRGWVLYVTVERAGASESTDPGAGVTLDDCSELSRDLSAALDVDDMIPGAYRLEVGTPGIERRLYTPADFRRFVSKLAKIKLHKPQSGEYTFRGHIAGVEGEDPGPVTVLLSKENSASEPWRFEFANINLANLVLEWGGEAKSKGPKGHATNKHAKKGSSKAGSSLPNAGASPSPGATAPMDEAEPDEQDDYSDELGADEFGQDAEFDSAATVATTQVKHGS